MELERRLHTLASKSVSPIHVETSHSVLKCKGVTKDTLQRFSLLGIVKHSLAIDKDYDLCLGGQTEVENSAASSYCRTLQS